MAKTFRRLHGNQDLQFLMVSAVSKRCFFISGGQTATSDPNGQLSGPAGARNGAAAAR